jgi:hypothetical protein
MRTITELISHKATKPQRELGGVKISYDRNRGIGNFYSL